VSTDLVSVRQLNRATLARQHLLERVAMPAYDMVHHLVGLQAQEPRDPYIGLWSRLVDFSVAELESLLLDRRVVRLAVQRGTVHAVTDDDCLVLRPLAQRVLSQQLDAHPEYGPQLRGVDLETVMSTAAEVLAEPRSTRQLRHELAARFPDHHAAALAFACRNLLPLIQIPPRGLWSRSGQVVGTTARAWLGRDVDPIPSVDDVMVRYVAAFGPATVQDATIWSRYTGLGEVFDRLRPTMRTYRDGDGREYFDVPEGPLPDGDTPAPIRILPHYDNVLLSHKHRSRFVGGDVAALNSIWKGQLGFVGSMLIDGMVSGMWRVDSPKRLVAGSWEPATMTITTLRRLPTAAAAEVTAEATRFLRFTAPDAGQSVRFATVG
jgi:Winged helix DNA-binding domain